MSKRKVIEMAAFGDSIMGEIAESMLTGKFHDKCLPKLVKGEEVLGEMTLVEKAVFWERDTMAIILTNLVDEKDKKNKKLKALESKACLQPCLSKTCKLKSKDLLAPARKQLELAKEILSITEEVKLRKQEYKFFNDLLWLMIRRRFFGLDAIVGIRKGFKIVKCNPEKETFTVTLSGPGIPPQIEALLGQ